MVGGIATLHTHTQKNITELIPKPFRFGNLGAGVLRKFGANFFVCVFFLFFWPSFREAEFLTDSWYDFCTDSGALIFAQFFAQCNPPLVEEQNRRKQNHVSEHFSWALPWTHSWELSWESL